MKRLSRTFFTAALLVSSFANADFSQYAIFSQHSKDLNLKFNGIAESNGIPQHITLVDSGVGALKKRFDMIDSAKKTIDVQYFIYGTDRTGRLFTQALIRKAKEEGVKVRMMIDTSKAVFELNKIFADRIIREGGKDQNGNPNIEIRYYNLDSLISIVSLNFRSHRKLIIVDNKIAVTGGRNMADEYFGLSPKYNFLDSDIFVESPEGQENPIVSAMTVDFEDFWNSPLSSRPGTPRPPNTPSPSPRNEQYHAQIAELKHYEESLIGATDYVTESDSDRALREQIEINGAKAFNGQDGMNTSFDGMCNNLVYASDHPGIGAKDGTRVLSQQLRAEVRRAGDLFANQNESDFAAPKQLMIESPYFIPNASMTDMLGYLVKNNIQMKVMTNSLYSTDAFYTVAAFNQRIKPLLDVGVQVSIYDGSSASNLFTADPKSQSARWGTHAKRGVIGNTIMVGTFNIDPRSDNLNAEMALICRDNPEAAAWVKKSIEFREKHASLLNKDGQRADGKSLKDGTSLFNKVEYWVSYPFVIMFGFLL